MRQSKGNHIRPSYFWKDIGYIGVHPVWAAKLLSTALDTKTWSTNIGSAAPDQQCKCEMGKWEENPPKETTIPEDISVLNSFLS